MPKLDRDIDDISDEGDIPSNGAPRHTESTVEADAESKDQLQEDLANDVGKMKKSKVKKEEPEPEPEPEPVTDDEDEDEENELEPVYEVEAIRGHEWRFPVGKRKGPKVLLYNVKWKNYTEAENTLEPEENLEEARDLLAKYHHKIGGAPQPESDTALSKKRSTKSLKEERNTDSLADDSPAPSAKRQKRTASSSIKDDPDGPEWGAWVPGAKSWENDIREIQTVERDPQTQDLFILIVFKNGKKSKVKREVVHKKCPLKMLEFYENHLNFSVSEAAPDLQHEFSDVSSMA